MTKEEKKKITTEELLSELLTTIKMLNERLSEQEKQKQENQKQEKDTKYEILKMIMEVEHRRAEWKDMLELIAIVRGNNYNNWQRRYR